MLETISFVMFPFNQRKGAGPGGADEKLFRLLAGSNEATCLILSVNVDVHILPETGSFQHWLHFSPPILVSGETPKAPSHWWKALQAGLCCGAVHQVLETFQTENFKSLLLHIETFKMPPACSKD